MQLLDVHGIRSNPKYCGMTGQFLGKKSTRGSQVTSKSIYLVVVLKSSNTLVEDITVRYNES